MSAENLLRKHLVAAAAQVEITPRSVRAVVGRVRRSRALLGLAAAAVLVAVVAATGMLRSRVEDVVVPPPTTTTTTEPSPTSTTSTTTTSTTTTTVPAGDSEPTVAWTAADAERDVENYLAALAGGAYDQAAWPVENNGVQFDGQSPDETPTEYLQRVCAGGACRGPYAVAADGPGMVDESTSQASSTVTVTHLESGESAVLALATFEGRRMVLGVPPLVPSTGSSALPEQLFGGDLPDRVVVQRFDALEIREGGRSEWVTNWWADHVVQIEQGTALISQRVDWIDHQQTVDVRDPSVASPADCGRLMTRGGTVLLFEGCAADGWAYAEIGSGAAAAPPIQYEVLENGDWLWFDEGGGTVLTGVGDADGNLVTLESAGVDLAGDDSIGHLRLSVDGTKVAYVDHRDPDAYSHFWSPVVVVKDVATGAELGRWVLDGPVLGLEFSGHWVVAREGSPDPAGLAAGEVQQESLVAINLDTGTVNRVQTGTSLFLPS